MRIIVVTNRCLAGAGFGQRVEALARAGAERIILREKDLSKEAYRQLLRSFGHVYGITPHLHSGTDLGFSSLHLPLAEAQKGPLPPGIKTLGVSVHSREEAVAAQKLGASYLVAGHIFPTECKKGLPPRGLAFLSSVTGAVDIPVFAIGGIAPENAASVMEAGAAGVCLMSSAMVCPNVEDLFARFHAVG